MPKAIKHDSAPRQGAYTPPEGTAVCPHCGATAPAIAPTPVIYTMMLLYRCPNCGQAWQELRQVDQPPERCWA
jgi:hypothetical protein